jgi:DNA-binding XRE family transcriptional regulator
MKSSATRDDFSDLLLRIEHEAEEEGPAGVADLRALQFKYQLINALIQQRRVRGLTQQQLADLAGIDQADVSKIERGRKSPTIDTYARLASALGMEPGLPLDKPLRRSPARRVVAV